MNNTALSVYPRILKTHNRQQIGIRPHFFCTTLRGEYEICIIPQGRTHPDIMKTIVSPIYNSIFIEYDFGAEGEYLIQINRTDLSEEPYQAVIYALDEDLYKRCAAKGSLIHPQTSSPAQTLANLRMQGDDFILFSNAITSTYYEADEYLKRFKHNMVIMDFEDVMEIASGNLLLNIAEAENAEKAETVHFIIFAESFTEEGLLKAVHENMYVFFGENNVVFSGSERLCALARFLLAHYFPYHDHLVRIEGELLERDQSISLLDGGFYGIFVRHNISKLKREWENICPAIPERLHEYHRGD